MCLLIVNDIILYIKQLHGIFVYDFLFFIIGLILLYIIYEYIYIIII